MVRVGTQGLRGPEGKKTPGNERGKNIGPPSSPGRRLEKEASEGRTPIKGEEKKKRPEPDYRVLGKGRQKGAAVFALRGGNRTERREGSSSWRQTGGWGGSLEKNGNSTTLLLIK